MDNAPPVACTIIIPTRDRLEYLQPCLESVLTTTSSSGFEILIVNNGSTEQTALDYLDSLHDQPLVRVIDWNQPFNFAALNNFAATRSTADVLCFLNNDVEILHSDWLDRLLPLAQRKDVGAVGCLLLYPDRTIQHGGIALDQNAFARHIAAGEPQNFYARAGFGQPFATEAVTAACMLTRRELFLGLDGFDAEAFGVAYNDVDYCLRLAARRLPCLMHPGVCLLHHESVSRQHDHLETNQARAKKEFDCAQGRWRHRLQQRHYKSGLPGFVALQKATQNDLEATIRRAGDLLLAPGPDAQIKSALSQPSPRSRQPGHVEEIFNLNRELSVLRKENLQLQEAHRLIEQSVFWQMTAPLRFLREQLSLRRRFRTKRTATADSGVPGSMKADLSSATEIPASHGKAEHDAAAQARLQQFLSGQDRLAFAATDQPGISILLVFYNQAHLSYLCLLSLLEHGDVPFEVIVVDNASSDRTGELLQRLDQVRILRNQSNLGFVHAVNQAAREARSPHLLLLNNDACIEPAALSSALETLGSASDIAAVGGKIKLLDGSLQEAGSIIWQGGSCRGYGRGQNPQDFAFMMQREVDYCSAAFLLLDAAIFRVLDGFDEDFAPAYYEESDYCIRLHKKGYRVLYEPRAQITHYEFASTGGKNRASQMQQAHRQILCRKHASWLQNQSPQDPEKLLSARTANRHPNILIVDDRIPYPGLGAGYPRCCHLLNTLAAAGVNLTFYPLQFSDGDWVEVYRLLAPGIEVAMGPGRDGLADFMQQRQGFYQKIMVSRVHNMVVFLDLLRQRPELLGQTELIFDAEAVSAPREIMRRRLLGERVSREEEDREITAELDQASAASRVAAVSPQEARLFHQFGLRQTFVVGHHLDPQPTEKPFAERAGLVFVGALRDKDSPNVDSLLWFLINCLPLIEVECPGVKLTVVGDDTAPSLAAVSKANVVFTGRLDSLDEVYSDARVFIAPTRFAAGIPHKVHEAASRGLPTVATTLLAGQLGWKHEQEMLCADDAAGFAAQCLRLNNDEALWNRLRSNGLAAVERDCSPAAFRQAVMQLFDLAPPP